MDVDPSTTRLTVEYAGRTIAFCVSCKNQFLAQPSALLLA
jgi:YHS domain-containing protein